MSGIRLCGYGCGCQSEDPSVRFGAKPTQRACARDFLRDKKRTREGRPHNQEKSAEETRGVGSREQVTASKCGPDAGLATVRGLVSLPGNFVRISLEYTLAIACRCTERCTKLSETSPFLRLELIQVHDCLFSFLPPSLLCMLCFVYL